VKIGGVLRGVLPRSSALRASGGGARGSLSFDFICDLNTQKKEM
jgi:hypothetical protein